MPKEFFIYEYDEKKNVFILQREQMTFIAFYYHAHYESPVDILMWLYDMAEYREDLDELENEKSQKLKLDDSRLKHEIKKKNESQGKRTLAEYK